MHETSISEDALDQLLREARTHSARLPDPVPVALLRKAYELARFGPTSADTAPARFVFLTTPGAKALLQRVLCSRQCRKDHGRTGHSYHRVGHESHETLPRVFPQRAMRSYFIAEQTLIDETAFRNSPLQAAYFILAARALGLDCVPMSWFDADRLNAEFSRRQVESESSLQPGL